MEQLKAGPLGGDNGGRKCPLGRGICCLASGLLTLSSWLKRQLLRSLTVTGAGRKILFAYYRGYCQYTTPAGVLDSVSAKSHCAIKTIMYRCIEGPHSAHPLEFKLSTGQAVMQTPQSPSRTIDTASHCSHPLYTPPRYHF